MRRLSMAIVWATLAVFLGVACTVRGADSLRPTILYIVADDLGWADVGYHGAKIQTPTLDRLDREGVRLDQHYVQPLCTLSRSPIRS